MNYAKSTVLITMLSCFFYYPRSFVNFSNTQQKLQGSITSWECGSYGMHAEVRGRTSWKMAILLQDLEIFRRITLRSILENWL